MRVIARSSLKRFIESLKGTKDYKAVKASLDAWFQEAKHADWKTPADVLRVYASASIVGSDRIVFNVKGNTYRLIVAVNYRSQILYIKWIGSHLAYDKIDVKTVDYEH